VKPLILASLYPTPSTAHSGAPYRELGGPVSQDNPTPLPPLVPGQSALLKAAAHVMEARRLLWDALSPEQQEAIKRAGLGDSLEEQALKLLGSTRDLLDPTGAEWRGKARRREITAKFEIGKTESGSHDAYVKVSGKAYAWMATKYTAIGVGFVMLLHWLRQAFEKLAGP